MQGIFSHVATSGGAWVPTGENGSVQGLDLTSIDRRNVGRNSQKFAKSAALAGVVTVFTAYLMGATSAEAQTRSLKLRNVHTNEQAEIVYKRGNSYDADGLKKINYILRDWRKNQPTRMNPRVLDVLWEVYRNTGATAYINVICGYRSAATNSMLRSRSKMVAEKSQHMLGNAVDYFIPGISLKTLRNAGIALQAGGVGYYPNSGSPFVHMDVGRVRHWGPISEVEVASAMRSGKRFQSGGGSVVAFADGGGKKRVGLLARLFGGGADEAEDDAESGVTTQVAAAAPPPKAVAKPKANAPLPGIQIIPPSQQVVQVASAQAAPAPVSVEEPQFDEPQQQTIVAALPPRQAPIPAFAPRPKADIGQQAIADATMAGEAVAEAAQPEEQMAANVPLPQFRPNYTPPAAEAPVPSDDSAALLAMASVEPDPQPAAFQTMPVPSLRPAQPVDIAEGATAKQGRAVVASAAPAVRAVAKAPAPTVASADIKTTQKSSRPNAASAKPTPKPVVVAAAPEAARWALDKGYVSSTSKRTKAPSFAYNVVRSAPLEVYTAGFQQGDEGADIHRFSGKAVKFMTVAKFQKK